MKNEQQNNESMNIEYKAVVDYHLSIVNSRFTIAGLYVAALGFSTTSMFSSTIAPQTHVVLLGLALFVTFCLWILELRSRSLYTNLAHQGIDIEQNIWKHIGFFSHQHKLNKPHSMPDCPVVFGKKIPVKYSKYISHSNGFDLLYLGSGLFFLCSLIWTIIIYY